MGNLTVQPCGPISFCQPPPPAQYIYIYINLKIKWMTFKVKILHSESHKLLRLYYKRHCQYVIPCPSVKYNYKLLISPHYSRVAAELIMISAVTSQQKLTATTSLLCIYFMKTISYIMTDKCLLLWVKLIHHLVIMKSVCNEHHQVLDLHHQLHLLQLHILGTHRAVNKV